MDGLMYYNLWTDKSLGKELFLLAKMGRPPKPDDERLKHGYRIRVNDSEKEFVEEYKKRHNIIGSSKVFRQGLKKLRESEGE